MTEVSVLSVKTGTTNVDLVNKTESLKTSPEAMNFVCLMLYGIMYMDKHIFKKKKRK